jgi:hypothetical protein
MEGRVPIKLRFLSPAILLGALLVTSIAAADELTKQECVSANESAQDLQRLGKLREARGRLAVCVSESCPGPVREDCAARLAEVDKAMPSLVFEVRDESDRDLSAIRITMDGQPLTDKLDGAAIPVDLGEHRFVFEAQGFARESRTLVMRQGDKNRRERIVLLTAHVAPPMSTASTTPAVSESTAEKPAGDGSAQRLLGLALGGAGVVGVVVGSVFGLVSKSTYDNALSSQCGQAVKFATNTCNATGVQDVNSAHSQATVSTVGFIAAAALLGGGAYLYFTAPKAGDVSVGPSVGAGSAGLSVRGAW